MQSTSVFQHSARLHLESAKCCCCAVDDSEPVGVGEDFEYRTSNTTFLMVRCLRCGLLFLNPRPSEAELGRIYPDNYHAFAFDEAKFGLIHQVRQRLESKRLLGFARGLPGPIKVLDVGCGDGFHLKLLKDFGPSNWQLEGVDTDARAIQAAQRHRLTVHQGKLESIGLDSEKYDLVLMIMTIEHLYQPLDTLKEVFRVLKTGGRLVIVTDNAGSPDFKIFQGRHWGGYHFPRHTFLFDRHTLGRTVSRSGLEIESIRSAMSPVNWVYSMRNWIDDWGGPLWVVNRLSLESPIALAAGMLFDVGWTTLGMGAILHGSFRKPSKSTNAVRDTAS